MVHKNEIYKWVQFINIFTKSVENLRTDFHIKFFVFTQKGSTNIFENYVMAQCIQI